MPPAIIVAIPCGGLIVTECLTAVISASNSNGELVLTVEPIAGLNAFNGVSGRLSVSTWCEDFKTVRFRLRSEASGAIAYLQGGMQLLALAADLGFIVPELRKGSAE
jgi:hypothetical protein